VRYLTVTSSEGPGELVTPKAVPATLTVTGSAGAVSLVGGGPGDPDLLTLRAEALLALAATVIVDASLVGLAAELAPHADIVPVADRTPAVAALLAAARPVVRLYAGDTWLHPGHGPESAALVAAGIPFEAVAGVATEIAVPATAGIPVHHRRRAVVCTFAAPDDAPPPTDPARTLVVLTDDLRATALALAADGKPDLPAAAIETDGPTTRAPLGELHHVAPERAGVLVVGAVAGLR
jgi:siroheme synthase